MAESILSVQRQIVSDFLRTTAHGDWKVVVLDTASKRLVDNVLSEDDILKEHVTNVEIIEDKRSPNPQMDVAYILSPEAHIVDCLLADLDRCKYRRTYIAWTSRLHSAERSRLDASRAAQSQISSMKTLCIDYYPRESHLILFRDPWSFPILFHPACNKYVRQHLADLSQKIVSVCVALGEYPAIRFFQPRQSSHEAAVLCSHLARFVQDELDQYAKYHQDFPPPSNRPRGALLIMDRSLDLFAPLLHEFTYQAMVHDLLPIKEGDKVTYMTNIDESDPSNPPKEVEIGEKDDLWVRHRHMHMKDVLDKLAAAFQAFKAKNPQFASTDQPSSLNNIKDMLAGLPQYQEGKEAFSLHLNMASDAMALFQKRKLAEIASVEQSLATGLDEDYKKPKNLTDQVVRLLDEPDVSSLDRLRLIMEYLLYRDGMLPADVEKLLAHAQLPAQDTEIINNLELVGAHVARVLKDHRPHAQPLLGHKQSPAHHGEEDSGLSRFQPVLKSVLEEQVRGTLDPELFPYTKPHLDASESAMSQDSNAQTSLRSAKPTWARTRPSAMEPRQRLIIFVAGGATYSEARACYEVSQAMNKDIHLATTHMLTPSLFLRQLGDLSVDRRRLNLPVEQPKPKAPAHVLDRELPPQPIEQPSGPPAKRSQQALPAAMARVNLNSAQPKEANGGSKASTGVSSPQSSRYEAKLTKDRDRDKDKDKDKKKKHHFFGSKK